MPEEIAIRDATPEDFDAIVALNDRFEHYTSRLDRSRLEALHAEAEWHRVATLGGEVVAFLLAFREGAKYDSPNYRWFSSAYERFLYIDRVIVAEDRHGRGLGGALYGDAIAFARRAGVERVVAEIDVEPLNARSVAFHDHYGFAEVGTQRVAGGAKRVSLRELRLA